MSKPKFEVGEVVRVIYSDGSVFAESAMITGHLFYEDQPVEVYHSGSYYLVSGLRYQLDIQATSGRLIVFGESRLSRIPPPQKSWEQLRAELKNSSTKELS